MEKRDGNGGLEGPNAVEAAIVETDEPVGEGAATVGDNYRYWREHGHEWADEYDRRKRDTPYYHLQELMLTDYISRCAPAKVLEFGCGVGRHLRNLSRLPGIDIHGYDQSRAMVSGCLRWTDQRWVDGHVRVGLPTGPLPYADGEFDVVYSAEVLLHSRPEDIEPILRELVRVCRGHILHLETSPDYSLIQEEHDGCWKHDLVAAYARIGYRLDMLDAGYRAHTPFRVQLADKGPDPAWPAAVLDVMRRAEADLGAGLSAVAEAVRRAEADRAKTVERLHARVRELEVDRDRLFAEAKEKQSWIESVEADRDRLFAEAKEEQAWIAKVEADRDRLFAEAREKQAWIAKVEADRDRLFAEAKEKQAWIEKVEAELSEVKIRLSSSMALAEASNAAAGTREAVLRTRVDVLAARLREQTDRLVAAEGVLRSFAAEVRSRLGVGQ